MGNIHTFEAGDVGLHPSEAGSSAFRELGSVQREFATQSMRLEHEAGTMMGRAISSIGSAIGTVANDIQERAQQHTDSQAELEANKDATATDLAMFDQISGIGTGRTDQNGNPAPDSSEYTKGASGLIDQYQKTLDAERDKFAASGASEAAQNRFASQQASRMRTMMVKAHSEQIAVAGQEALGNINKSLNTSAALIDRHPEMLDSELGRFDSMIGAATGSIGTVAAKETLGPKALESKAILASSAIFSYAKNGQLDQANRVLNNPKYDEFLGQNRAAIEDKVRSITNARVRDQNVADKAAADKLDSQRQDFISKVYQNSQLPPEQQDPRFSRRAMETSPLFAGDAKGLVEARKTLDGLTSNTIDPDASGKIAQGISRGITDGSITTPAQIDQAFKPGNPDASLTWQDRTKLQQELKDAKDNPAVKEFNGAMKDWLTRNEGMIDRTVGAMPGPSGKQKSELGQENVSRWSAEVQRRAAQMRAAGKDPHELLDPNSPNSMVTPAALAPYRTTLEMEQKYQAEQKVGDAAINKQRGQDVKEPAPVQIPKGMTPADALKSYPPGTPVILPDGTTGRVPGARNLNAPQKMNFAPDDQPKAPAVQAIERAMQPRPDAHLDKNLFSSGRAEAMGIKGGVGENLTTISVQGHNLSVNASAAPHFKGFLDELTARGYKINEAGGFSDRMKRGTLASYSEHAFGNAIDINPSRNPFRSRQTDLPNDIGSIAAKYGLIWGGDWSGRSADPMHFEWSGKGGATTFASAR